MTHQFFTVSSLAMVVCPLLAGQTDPASRPLSLVPFVSGVVATAVPVAVGAVLWARGNSNCDATGYCLGPDRVGPALLIASGLALGPSVGYAVAGRGGRATSGAALRVGATLLSFVPAFGICGWGCGKNDPAYSLAWLVVATGTGLTAASAIYDLARLRSLKPRTPRTAELLPFTDGRSAGFAVHAVF